MLVLLCGYLSVGVAYFLWAIYETEILHLWKEAKRESEAQNWDFADLVFIIVVIHLWPMFLCQHLNNRD